MAAAAHSPSKSSSKGISSKPTTAGASDLTKLIERSPAPSVILVLAPDEIRKRRIVEHLVQKLTKGATSELHRLSGSQITPESLHRLADSAAALSLFAKQEFSWIRNLEECSAGAVKVLAKVLSRFSPHHIALFTASQLAASHPVLEYAKKDGTLLQLPELTGYELHRWVERELKRTGFTEFSEESITTLIAAGEENADTIVGMVEHLWLYCDSPRLTKDDIDAVFIHKTVPGEFDFVDALVSGNIARAEVMVSELLAAGKNPFMLLALLGRSFSSYLSIRALMHEGVGPQDIRQKLGITPWVFNKQLPAARRYSIDDLERGMKALVSIDSKLKNKSLSADVLMSSMIADLRPSGHR